MHGLRILRTIGIDLYIGDIVLHEGDEYKIHELNFGTETALCIKIPKVTEEKQLPLNDVHKDMDRVPVPFRRLIGKKAIQLHDSYSKIGEISFDKRK